MDTTKNPDENTITPIIDTNPNRIQGQQSNGDVRSEVPVATNESQPMPIVSEEVTSFYKRYEKAMLAWAKEKGNMSFPIYEDPKTGKLTWINRAMRSAARKAKNAKHR